MTRRSTAASFTSFASYGHPCRGRRGAAVRRRPDPLALLEQLESRVLLTATGALEVWAGNTDLTGNGDALFSPDQNGYTLLGVTNAQNSAVPFDTNGVQYNFFVIVSRGQVQIDSVEGSDSTFLTGPDSTGNAHHNNNGFVLGTQVQDDGTYAGYAEFANPDSWTSLTVQTGSMSVMLEGQVSVESDYLPGAANPYNLSGEMRINDNGLITSGEVRTPAGIWYPLSLNNDSGNSNEQWRFGENFSSLANLTTVMPSGIYTFVVNSPLGTTTTQFSYTQSSLTPVPSLIGLVNGATGISTNKTFNWNPITDSNPNDNLNLEIDGPDNSNNSIVNQQLDTSATTSGPVALDANSNYSLELSLNSFTQSTNSDGFNFNTDTSNETDLLFTTSATVIPPALTITWVGFPDGTIQPGDWLVLPISGGNAGGNAIGKSGGVAVPIDYQVVLATAQTFTGSIIIGTGTIGGGSGGGSIGGESFGGGGPVVQIPANITPGTYWVGLKGDSTNVVFNNEDVPTSAFSATQITISPSGTIALTPPADQSATATESQSFNLGSFTPANTTTPYTADINWGDGSPDTVIAMADSGAIPAVNHTYAASGNNTVTVTVADWDGEATKSASFTATVAPPPPNPTGALEVWGGDTDLTGDGDALFSPDQNGYTLLGVTNAQNSLVNFDTAGVQYNFFVIVSRGQVQVNSVEGSDSTFLTGPDSTGNVQRNDDGFTLGTQVQDDGTYAGYAEFANPDSWTGLTVQTGSMSLMLEGQISTESDYLPGAANPFNFSGQLSVDDNGLITGGEVRTPTGTWYPLMPNTDSGSGNPQWQFQNNFNSLANLTTAIPNGTYTFVLTSPLGTATTQFSYTRSALTPVPKPTGLTDGATGISINPTFNWNAISDANPDDNLELELDGPDSSSTLIDQQLDTTATGYSPATLTASSNYELQLRLNSNSQSTNADGFSFDNGITNDTDLLFRTAGTAGGAPAINLAAVDFPAGTIHPGDWIPLLITGANTGGNAIGKNAGVVVPIQFEAVLSTTGTWGGGGNIILAQSNIGSAGFLGGDSFGGGSDSGPVVQIPASVAPGTYFVGLRIDSSGVVSGNTGNTTAFSATQITITANGTLLVTPPEDQSAIAGEAQLFDLGSFSPSNTTSPYTADVNWGDGSPDTIIAMPDSGTLPEKAHAFTVSGNDTVTVTIADWDGEATSGTSFGVATSPDTPAQLVFLQNPSNVTSGLPDSPPITVKVEDQFNNLVTSDNSDVTLSVNSGPGSASGTLTVAAVNGVATFTDVRLDTAGTYTLQAADTPLTPAISTLFTVNSPAADHAPTLTAIKSFKTAVAGLPFTITYSQLQANATGFADIDGDTLQFQVDAPAAGASIALNGVTQNAFPFDVAPGGTLTVTLATSGNVDAFSVRTFDGTLTSAKDIPVIIATNPEPTVSVTVSPATATATEVNNGIKGLGVVTFSRNGPTTLALPIDYSVADTTGSPNDGTNYTILSGTVTIPAGKPSVTVSIVPIDNIARSGNLPVTLTVADDGSNYIIGPKSSAAVTITDNNLSPFSVAGESLTASITAGIAPFAASGTYQLFFNAADNSFVLVGGPTLGSMLGTYSYTRTGPTTATLDLTDSLGTSDGTVTFSSATSAIFSFDQDAGPGSQAANVTLVAAPKTNFAPASAAGLVVSHKIVSGTGLLPATGSDQGIFAQSSDLLIVAGVAPVRSSVNTYTYEKFGPNLGIVTFTNAASVNGFTTLLYTSATAATYVTTLDGGAGTQHGKATIAATPHATLAPVSLSGKTITNAITSGAAPFALKGGSSLIISATAYSFSQTTPVAVSTGTYTYEPLTATIGYLSFNDSLLGPSFDLITFTSPTKATYVLANLGTAGWQRGKATLS